MLGRSTTHRRRRSSVASSPLLVRKKAGGWEKRRRLNVEGRGGKKRGSLLLPLPFFVFRFSRPLFPPFSPVARRFSVRQKVGFFLRWSVCTCEHSIYGKCSLAIEFFFLDCAEYHPKCCHHKPSCPLHRGWKGGKTFSPLGPDGQSVSTPRPQHFFPGSGRLLLPLLFSPLRSRALSRPREVYPASAWVSNVGLPEQQPKGGGSPTK